MIKDRVILHSDINHCYAQIEEMKYPELRDVPMAVGGSEEKRHGIILAKNDLAKTYGIKTGESLVEARNKCKNLLIIHPNYEEYIYYTNKVKAIYREYTDKVESYGLDEAWLDVTESIEIFGSGVEIAKTIQERVHQELGLTVSIGVSWNKIFAKLGSDMEKKKGLVEINRSNYQDIVWPRPVEDLFYVGRATKKKLNNLWIDTIGKLAGCRRIYLELKLGKIGGIIWDFAHGNDHSFVPTSDYRRDIKSVGNSITAVHDMNNENETLAVFYVLAESVASRLRDYGFKAKVVSINLRDNKLRNLGTRQIKLSEPINTAYDIMKHVRKLLSDNYDFKRPLRSIGISVSSLTNQIGQLQFALFEEDKKQEDLERTIDKIREKYGYEKVGRAGAKEYGELTEFDPKGNHTIHPVSYF